MAEVYDQDAHPALPFLPPPPNQRRDFVDNGWGGDPRWQDFEEKMNEPEKAQSRWRERLARLAARPFLRRIERG